MSNRVSAPLVVWGLLLLAGCTADYGTDASYENGLQPGDSSVLVGPVESLVRRTVRPDTGSIAIATPSVDGVISPQLRADLAQQGYHVAAPDDEAKHRLGYLVMPVANQMLIRVFLDHLDGAQLYTRDAAGHLQPSGPLAVRRTEG